MRFVLLLALLYSTSAFAVEGNAKICPQYDDGDGDRPAVDVGTFRRYVFSTFSWRDATDPSVQLAEYLWPRMSMKAREEMLHHVDMYQCSLKDVTAWYERRSQLMVLQVHCLNDVTEEQENSRPKDSVTRYLGWRHPLILVVTEDHSEVVANYDDFTFNFGLDMFGVTDLDRDSKPEFWLEGYNYECGSAEEEPDCDGDYAIEIVEADGGQLMKLPKDWKY